MSVNAVVLRVELTALVVVVFASSVDGGNVSLVLGGKIEGRGEGVVFEIIARAVVDVIDAVVLGIVVLLGFVVAVVVLLEVQVVVVSVVVEVVVASVKNSRRKFLLGRYLSIS